MSRTRHTLTGIHPAFSRCLTTVQGGYLWRTDPLVEIDLLTFEGCMPLLHACTAPDDTSRALFDRTLSLYHGDLLGEHAHKVWAAGRARAVQALYLAAVLHYLTLLQEADALGDMLLVCRQAIALLPFSEVLRLRMSDILLKLRQTGLSPEALPLRDRLLTIGSTLDDSIARLRGELLRTDSSQAIVCDGSILREVCQLMLRSLDRLGGPLSLGLMMFSASGDHVLSPMRLDLLSDSLIQLAASELRRSDAVCRVGPDQIALLLPMCSADSARVIMERTMRRFFAQYAADDCLITFRVADLAS